MIGGRIGRVLGALALVGTTVGVAGPATAQGPINPVDCGTYTKLITKPGDGDHDPEANGGTYALWIGKSSDSVVTPGGALINFATTEQRIFCVFDVPPVVGDIAWAEFRIMIDRYVSHDAAERLTLYDVTTPTETLRAGGANLPDIWRDLGSGVTYGSRRLVCDAPLPDTRCSKNRKKLIKVPLNGVLEEMLHDGGTIAIGAALSTLSFPVDKCWRKAWDDGPIDKPVICHEERMGSPVVIPSLWVELKAYRADSRIRVGTNGPFVGDDITNTTGQDQFVFKSTAPGGTATFNVSVQNDGNVRDRFKVQGYPSPSGFKVRYLDAGSDVTPAVIAGTYRTPPLDPGETHLLTIRFTAKASTAIGLQNYVLVTARSVADPAKVDAVGASLKTK